MKKTMIMGLALAFAALLTCSCNKNRFDLSQMDSVEASGQWKLPIGSARITLDRVMGQFAQNSMVSYDENGHLQLSYHFTMDPVLKGSDFMHYRDLNFDFSFQLDNPYPYQLEEPYMDSLVFDQEIELVSDAFRLNTATIRSGTFVFHVTSDLVDIDEIVIRSNSVRDADGSPFERSIKSDSDSEIDMAGAYFEAYEEDMLKFTYVIHYLAYDFTEPEIHFDSRIGLRDICIQELGGYLDSYPTRFVVDESFNLPFENVSGMMHFVDTRLMIKQRNSFDVAAKIRIDTALLSGGPSRPAMIFDEYPVNIQVGYSPTYTNAFDDRISIGLSTDYDRVYVSGDFILNPDGFAQNVTLYDTASMGLSAEGVLPMKFNIPGVVYSDTLDLNLSSFNAPELIKEVILGVIFQSELPFNLRAQLYTLDSLTGRVSDSLFTTDHFINGSFTDEATRTESEISITHERLAHLMAANKMLVRLGVDTDNKDVYLDLDDAIGLTLKADVIYDGEMKLK